MINGYLRKDLYVAWYLDGLLHRDDGPAIEYDNGGKEWWIFGQLHRIDGPAIEGLNDRSWWRNGLLHREDGPAIESNNHGKNEWYINGVEYSDEQFNQWLLKRDLLEKLDSTFLEKHHQKKSKI